MPYYWRHFFLSFNLSNVHTAGDRCYHHTQPRRVLEFVILSAVDSMSYTPSKFVFSNYFVFQSLRLKIAFSRSDCFLVTSWLTDWSGHCGLVHTEVKIAQKNGATLGNKGNCKLQRSAAVIATQGINFVAPRRRFFCCPRRQWLECYDCHATWCEEQATKRFCCPQGESEYRAINQTSPTMLLRKNLHCYSSVARKKICRVKPRIPGDASWPTNTTVVSPTYQS